MKTDFCCVSPQSGTLQGGLSRLTHHRQGGAKRASDPDTWAPNSPDAPITKAREKRVGGSPSAVRPAPLSCRGGGGGGGRGRAGPLWAVPCPPHTPRQAAFYPSSEGTWGVGLGGGPWLAQAAPLFIVTVSLFVPRLRFVAHAMARTKTIVLPGEIHQESPDEGLDGPLPRQLSEVRAWCFVLRE